MDAHSVLLLDEYRSAPQYTSPKSPVTLFAARLRRQFPSLNDDCTLTEVLEESGRRIAAREERKGPLDNLHAYAWVVVQAHGCVATSTRSLGDRKRNRDERRKRGGAASAACRIRHIRSRFTTAFSTRNCWRAPEPDGTANRKGKECRSLRRRDRARLRNIVSHDLQRLAPSQTEDAEAGRESVFARGRSIGTGRGPPEIFDTRPEIWRCIPRNAVK